jgi:hypothetical protein
VRVRAARRTVEAVKTCANCGAELPELSRSNRRYCDARCRRRAHERRHAPLDEADSELPREQLAPVVPISDGSGLAEAVERATSETRLTGLVAAEAGRGNWRAAAWILERRYPDRWAPIRRRPDGELEVVDDPMFAEVDELRRRRERQPRK